MTRFINNFASFTDARARTPMNACSLSERFSREGLWPCVMPKRARLFQLRLFIFC